MAVNGSGARSFDLLWGDTQRPSRGPKPALTLDGTVAAGIEVADAEGLSALTMSRVAEKLGVTTMALYRYVPGKEELVDLMVDRALGAPLPLGGVGWRTQLADWARAELALFCRHPWLLESLMTRVSVGPNWVAWFEAALEVLTPLNLLPGEAVAVVFLVDGHVRSAAQLSIGAIGTGAWAANFGRVLEKVRDDKRYPVLAAIAAAQVFVESSQDEENTFEFGLERLLDGVEAFSRSRSAPKRTRRAGKPAKPRP